MEGVKMNRWGRGGMNKAVFIVFSAVVATLAVGVAVNAAQLANVVIGPGYVEWAPINAGGYTLSVATPNGSVVKKTFAKNENPAYSGSAAGSLEDGNYAYELVLNPAPSAVARQAGGGTDENGRQRNTKLRSASSVSPKPSIQTGYFTVANGSVIDPNIKE